MVIKINGLLEIHILLRKLSMMKQPTRGMITAHLGQPYHDV